MLLAGCLLLAGSVLLDGWCALVPGGCVSRAGRFGPGLLGEVAGRLQDDADRGRPLARLVAVCGGGADDVARLGAAQPGEARRGRGAAEDDADRRGLEAEGGVEAGALQVRGDLERLPLVRPVDRKREAATRQVQLAPDDVSLAILCAVWGKCTGVRLFACAAESKPVWAGSEGVQTGSSRKSDSHCTLFFSHLLANHFIVISTS